MFQDMFSSSIIYPNASITTPILVLAVLYLLCRFVETYTLCLSPQEPAFNRSRIPLLGHIIGFLRLGNKYLEGLPQDEPISTINFFHHRAYIITSLKLASAVQRQSSTISFFPIVKQMAVSFSEFEPHLAQLFDADERRSERKSGLAVDTLNSYHRAFGSGAGSENLQIAMLDELMSILDGAEANFQKPQPLYAWIKSTITRAAMKAVYGPRHPFMDPEIENAFWTYELESAPLLLNFAPSIVARKAVRARNKLIGAFAKYYETGALDDASELAKARYKPPADYGLQKSDIARLEPPFIFAVVATSVPSCFWAFVEIFAQPDLVSELRQEIGKVVTVDRKVNPPAFVVNIELLKTKCPLLLSVFQETLRRYSFFSLMRVVTKNTVLADQYLLKKDSLVLIPNNVIHGNNSIWGPTAGETDFYRFTRNADNTKSAQIPPNNYRSFGQPPNLCPGRHFATTEIMATLAVLIMRFDFTPKLGKWETPPSYFAIFAAIMPPKKDLDVSISVRQECRGRWSFNLGNAAVKVPLVCG